ncbi:hypothetical protein HK097_001965, partial [Rhizophlyctis rosea]
MTALVASNTPTTLAPSPGSFPIFGLRPSPPFHSPHFTFPRSISSPSKSTNTHHKGRHNVHSSALPQPVVSLTGGKDRQEESQALTRALSKIASLEKTIDWMQGEHAGMVEGLHREIGRLQGVCG